jgi:hypothetical protein
MERCFYTLGRFGVLELIGLLLQIKSHRFLSLSDPKLLIHCVWYRIMSTTTISGGSLIKKIEGAKMPLISTEMSDNRTLNIIVWDISFLSHVTLLT